METVFTPLQGTRAVGLKQLPALISKSYLFIKCGFRALIFLKTSNVSLD